METNPIIRALLEVGIEVRLALVTHKHQEVVYQVGGFYKSGYVELHNKLLGEGEYETQGFVAHARYGETEEIRDLRDLVLFNYYWWERGFAGSDTDTAPAPGWIELYLKFGLVKTQTTTRYVPT